MTMIESTGEKPTPQQRTQAALHLIANGLRRHAELLTVLSSEVAPGAHPAIVALGEHIEKAAALAERLQAILSGGCSEGIEHHPEASERNRAQAGALVYDERPRAGRIEGKSTLSGG